MSKVLQVTVSADYERRSVQEANITPENAIQDDVTRVHLGVWIHSALEAPDTDEEIREASED